MQTAHEYNTRDFTANANALFDSDYSTTVLAHTLAEAISIRSNDPRRVAFLTEYGTGNSPWVRGVICKALDDAGETVSRINRRRA